MSTAALDYAHRGQEIIDGTSAYTGQFCALQCITECTVAAMSWTDSYLANVTTSKTWADLDAIPAGTILLGRFKSITLTSGNRAIAYKE